MIPTETDNVYIKLNVPFVLTSYVFICIYSYYGCTKSHSLTCVLSTCSKDSFELRNIYVALCYGIDFCKRLNT